jgi:hypothetical protein
MGLRVRPVPELGTCVIYTPARPRLYTLNPNAWLIFELATRHPIAGLEDAYFAHTVPPMTNSVARRQLQEGLEMLTQCGILEQVSPLTTEGSPR